MPEPLFMKISADNFSMDGFSGGNFAREVNFKLPFFKMRGEICGGGTFSVLGRIFPAGNPFGSEISAYHLHHH